MRYIDDASFLNFIQTCTLKSIRSGSQAGDPKVVDIGALDYASDGTISFKLNFADDWKPLQNKREGSTAGIQALVHPTHDSDLNQGIQVLPSSGVQTVH